MRARITFCLSQACVNKNGFPVDVLYKLEALHCDLKWMLYSRHFCKHQEK